MQSRLAKPADFQFTEYDETCMPKAPGNKLMQTHQIRYSDEMSKYFNQWSEHMFAATKGNEVVLSADTSCKVGARTLENGVRISTTNQLAVMANATGQIVGTAMTSSGGPFDESAEEMLTSLGLSLTTEQKDSLVIFLDNPVREAVQFRKCLGLSNAIPGNVFTFNPSLIEVVTTKEACDAACAALKQTGNRVCFDTENVLDFADMARTDTASCICQLYAGSGSDDEESKCYIFQLKQFDGGHAYASFLDLFADPDVKLVAQCANSVDKPRLKKRFGNIVFENVVELESEFACPDIVRLASNNKLDSFVGVALKKSLPGKGAFNHAKWDNLVLTPEQCMYAACDVVCMADCMAVPKDGLKEERLAFDRLDEAGEDSGYDSESVTSDALLESAVAALAGSSGAPTTSEDAATEAEAGETAVEDDANDDADATLLQEPDSLFVACLRMIEEYAADGDRTSALRLPAGLSPEQRRALHNLSAEVNLNSYSVGETASLASVERRLIVEKPGRFTVLPAYIGARAIGYLVEDGAGRRGIVIKYDGDAMWTASFEKENEGDDSNTQYNLRQRKSPRTSNGNVSGMAGPAFAEDLIEVDLGKLNAMLECRWLHDKKNADDDDVGGGAAADSSAAASTDAPGLLKADPKLLDSYLHGVDKNWNTTSLLRQFMYDKKHFLGIFGTISSANKTSTIHRVFMIALADVFSRICDQEMERIIAWLLRRGWKMEKIRKLKRSYFRRLARTISPEPEELIRGVIDVYNVFLNVENENGGSFFGT